MTADNDIQAIQMASAATPDGCRSTYEEITRGAKIMPYGKGILWFKTRKTIKSKRLNKVNKKHLPTALKKKIMAAKKKKK